MTNNFESSESLYGVDPKTLADMKYKDALQIMKDALWIKKRELADELYQCSDAIEAALIQDNMRRTMKAIDLNELRIEELR